MAMTAMRSQPLIYTAREGMHVFYVTSGATVMKREFLCET